MSESPLTISVPEAGRRYFGLSRNGSYSAAARGELPTVRIGRLLRVPVRAVERMLDGADGHLSAITNLTRAKDAVACFMETEERRRRRRRHRPSEGRLRVKTAGPA